MSSNTSFLTLERNTIKYMLGYVEAYEQIKKKERKEFKTARAFFAAKGICYQNFYKFYNRYKSSGRDEQKLLPSRRGSQAPI